LLFYSDFRLPKTRNGTNGNATESHGTERKKIGLKHGTFKNGIKKLIYFRPKCDNGMFRSELFFYKKKTIPFD